MRSDEAAEFAGFVRARGPSLLRTAHLLTGDRGAAEDLLQQALERLLRHWSRMDGNPEGYVRRTLVSLSTDRWRLRARRPREAATELPERATPEDLHARVEDRHDLVLALRALDRRMRAASGSRPDDEVVDQARQLLGRAPTLQPVRLALVEGLRRLDGKSAEPGRVPVGREALVLRRPGRDGMVQELYVDAAGGRLLEERQVAGPVLPQPTAPPAPPGPGTSRRCSSRAGSCARRPT